MPEDHCIFPPWGMRPNRVRNSTLLPAPLGPTMARTSPCLISKSRFSITRSGPNETSRSETLSIILDSSVIPHKVSRPKVYDRVALGRALYGTRDLILHFLGEMLRLLTLPIW